MKSRREALLAYGRLLAEGSSRLGIVSRTDRDRLLMRHVRESLEPALPERLASGARVLDVGSGGGLPGIPLAVLREDLRLTLLEPRKRRAAFLERVVLALGLENAAVFDGPLEELGRTESPPFDAVVARAVRWTREMVRALERLTVEGARLHRFGPALPGWSGVECLGLTGDENRTLQVWSRSAWGRLPEAP